MNILFVTPVWGHLGGLERYVADCVQEFTRMGHVCSVLYGRKSNKSVESDIATLLHGTYQASALSIFDSPNDVSEVERLDAVLKTERPDVIFTTGVRNYALLSRLRGYGRLVPMSHECSLACMRMSRTTYFRRKICTHKLGHRCLLHGCLVRKSHENDGYKLVFNSVQKHQMLLSMYRSIGVHLVASNYVKQTLVQHGFEPEQVKVVGYFTNLKPQPTPALVGQKPIITFIGRMNRYKGIDYLIRALAHVSTTFRCSVIGDGEYLPHCRNLAHKLGLCDVVDFLGWQSSEEITEHLRKASVAVVPSVFPEPFGIVGLEAMMCSKPVVAFDAGGISDWLKDGRTGYLVPVKNAKALGQRIDALLKDPQRAAQMGAEGHRFVTSNFSKEQHFAHLLSAFADAVATKGSSTPVPTFRVLR